MDKKLEEISKKLSKMTDRERALALYSVFGFVLGSKEIINKKDILKAFDGAADFGLNLRK